MSSDLSIRLLVGNSYTRLGQKLLKDPSSTEGRKKKTKRGSGHVSTFSTERLQRRGCNPVPTNSQVDTDHGAVHQSTCDSVLDGLRPQE